MNKRYKTRYYHRGGAPDWVLVGIQLRLHGDSSPLLNHQRRRIRKRYVKRQRALFLRQWRRNINMEIDWENDVLAGDRPQGTYEPMNLGIAPIARRPGTRELEN